MRNRLLVSIVAGVVFAPVLLAQTAAQPGAAKAQPPDLTGV